MNELSTIVVQPQASPVSVYLMGLPSGLSRTTMKAALARAAFFLSKGLTWDRVPWDKLRYQHVQALRAWLMAEYAPATGNQCLAAVRGVLKESWKLGLMPPDDYHRAIDIKSIPNKRLPKGREVARQELSALLAACAEDGTAAGLRDQALIWLMYGAGLRRAEAVSVTMDRLVLHERKLRVLGKGNKERITYLGKGAARPLADWLAIRGDQPGPVLLQTLQAIGPGGTRQTTVLDKGLHANTVASILERRQVEAKLSPFTAHDLRRTWIGDLLEGGAELSAVAAMAGHDDVNTTARYDRRGERTKRRAADLLPEL